jgi:hypothetical protein
MELNDLEQFVCVPLGNGAKILAIAPTGERVMALYGLKFGQRPAFFIVFRRKR